MKNFFGKDVNMLL